MRSVTVVFKKKDLLNRYPDIDLNERSAPFMMFKSGAKLYKGNINGTYRISGYAQNGSDVSEAVKELFNLA